MPAPSIKGTAFQSVAEDVRRLAASGRVSREALEARLEADDLRLLDEKVAPGLWYPLSTYRRLTEVLLEVEGRGDPAYVVRRGARAAERLFAALGEWDTGGIWPNFGPAHDARTARRAYDAETLAGLAAVVEKYDPDGVLAIGDFTRAAETEESAA